MIDANNGKVLYAQDADAARYPASLTKMMTLYMLFEAMRSGRVTRDTPMKVSAYAAARLNEQSRIASFSIGGWDSHARQEGVIANALGQLATALMVLQRDLGPNWDRTTVMALTEFGRTVRQNGSAGTDHGTGGAMLYAGGGVRGGCRAAFRSARDRGAVRCVAAGRPGR